MRTFLETVLFGWLPAWIGYSYGHRHGQAFAAKAAREAAAGEEDRLKTMLAELQETTHDSRLEPTMKQVTYIIRLCRQKKEAVPVFEGMTRMGASEFIDWLKKKED